MPETRIFAKKCKNICRFEKKVLTLRGFKILFMFMAFE